MARKHPFADIRDGPTGGTSALLRAFEEFAAAVPLATIRKKGLAGMDDWRAWDVLRRGKRKPKKGEKPAGLEIVFTEPTGPLAFSARAGARRGSEMASGSAARLASDPVDLAIRERAARWAAAHGADELVGETRKTRRAIAATISRSIRHGPAREAARDIMAIRGFGLNPRQESQLQRQIERWRAEKGATTRNVRRKARKLHRRLLFRRAKGIWVYQKRTAYLEGARQAWEELQAAGRMAEDAELVWDHVGDAPGHPCPRCASLIGTTTGVTADFEGRPVEGGGRRYEGRQLTRRRPPEHISCDCFLRLQ